MKKNDNKKHANPREELAKLLKLNKRELFGPKAYSESPIEDVLKWIEDDLSKGYFIEAYTLTDQYIETILKYSLFGYLYFPRMTKIKLETALKIYMYKKHNNLLSLYVDFKRTRDDFVHNSVFYPKRAKRLKNTKKLRNLPLRIIQSSEKFFLDRAEKVFEYFAFSPTTKENKDIFFKLWIHTLKSIKKLKTHQSVEFVKNSYDKVYAQKTTRTK